MNHIIYEVSNFFRLASRHIQASKIAKKQNNTKNSLIVNMSVTFGHFFISLGHSTLIAS